MRFAILLVLFFCLATSSATEVYRQPAGIADMDSPFITAGYNALFTCSAHFIAQRPLEDIKKVELADTIAMNLPDPIIDETRHFVTVSHSEEMIRIAAFRKGMGCTLLPPHWQTVDVEQPFAHSNSDK